MRTHSMRRCAAVVIAVMVVTTRPVVAQSQSGGWPDAAGDAKSPKTVTAKPAPAAVPSTPAAAPKVAARPKVDAPVAAKPASAPAPAAASAAAPAPAKTTDIGAAEVVSALQQQAEILKRLAAEMEAQRAVIKEQQEKIKAIEIKSMEKPSASAAPAVKTPPPPAITVETGGIKLKVSGLFQGWYSASDAAVVDTFRLRRAELKFSGDISPRIKWAVMVDPAKTLALSTTTGSMGGQSVVTGTSISQSGRLLQDAFVSLNWKPVLSIEVGQQKVPLGMEGTISSGKLDVVERALFMTDKARGAGYADLRDFGVIVRGKAAGGQIEYAGGVFNGLGEAFNDTDRNEDKPMAARIVAKPAFVKGLQVGASIAREHFQISDATARERQGVELAYARGFFGFKGEFMGGRDAAVTRQGGYAQVSARVSKTLTALARFDAWDPDTRGESTAATVTERDWLGGFTYVLHPSGVWLQANYIRKTFGGLAPSRNVFLTNVQTAW